MPDNANPEIIVLIFLMAAVTYLPRVLPVLLLARRRLPAVVESWLSFVPVSVLAALLAPSLLAPAGALELAPGANPAFWVSLPVFAIAILTRNLFATVLFGMTAMALFRFLML